MNLINIDLERSDIENKTLEPYSQYSDNLYKFEPKINPFRIQSKTSNSNYKNSRNQFFERNNGKGLSSNSSRRYQLRCSSRESTSNNGFKHESYSQSTLNSFKNSENTSNNSWKKVYFKFFHESHIDPATFTASLETPLAHKNWYKLAHRNMEEFPKKNYERIYSWKINNLDKRNDEEVCLSLYCYRSRNFQLMIQAFLGLPNLQKQVKIYKK